MGPKVQQCISLTASGKKLFVSLVVLALMLRSLLFDGRSQSTSPFAGWAEYLIPQKAFGGVDCCP